MPYIKFEQSYEFKHQYLYIVVKKISNISCFYSYKGDVAEVKNLLSIEMDI